MREAAARLRTGGRIVNFSSSVIGLALPGYAVYAATKAAAIETMTNISHAATNAGQPASTVRPMSCEMTRNTPTNEMPPRRANSGSHGELCSRMKDIDRIAMVEFAISRCSSTAC
jgi:NAD(P)-dependent dehydrogenase (short-subunit alcohol dehydrogenase family)